MTLSHSDAIANINEVLNGAPGDYLASIYNQICSDKIRYAGDSLYEQEPDGESPSESNKVLQAQKADELFASCQFPADVTVESSGKWNHDDDAKENDWSKIVYVKCDDDIPEIDTRRISFHVRFALNSAQVNEVYALWMDTGNDVRCVWNAPVIAPSGGADNAVQIIQ